MFPILTQYMFNEPKDCCGSDSIPAVALLRVVLRLSLLVSAWQWFEAIWNWMHLDMVSEAICLGNLKLNASFQSLMHSCERNSSTLFDLFNSGNSRCGILSFLSQWHSLSIRPKRQIETVFSVSSALGSEFVVWLGCGLLGCEIMHSSGGSSSSIVKRISMNILSSMPSNIKYCQLFIEYRCHMSICVYLHAYGATRTHR